MSSKKVGLFKTFSNSKLISLAYNLQDRNSDPKILALNFKQGYKNE